MRCGRVESRKEESAAYAVPPAARLATETMAGGSTSVARRTHRLEALPVLLGLSERCVCGRLCPADELAGLHLDLRDILFDDVERRVGVLVCEREREDGLEAGEDLGREVEGVRVERGDVGVLGRVRVRGRERVLDDGVVEGLFGRDG